MNILVDPLPDAIEVNGHDYPINTDFRVSLRTILAFEDSGLAGIEKQMVLLQNLYIEQPENILEAFKQGIKFLNGGVESEEENRGPRVYSFEKDAQYIMAAFQQTHGIDLEKVDMHWWKFLALFMDIGGETTFSSIVGLRQRMKSGKASKEDKAAANKMRSIIDLPEIDRRTPEEREMEQIFNDAIEKGKKKK